MQGLAFGRFKKESVSVPSWARLIISLVIVPLVLRLIGRGFGSFAGGSGASSENPRNL